MTDMLILLIVFVAGVGTGIIATVIWTSEEPPSRGGGGRMWT